MDEFTTDRPERQQQAAGPFPSRPDRPWPPPLVLQRVLAAARRRYHHEPLVQRPSLHDPQNCVGLFALPDLLTLAKCGYWPLSAQALAWLTRSPSERARRRRRLDRRIAAVVREIMAADLPAALDVIKELQRRQSS
jgi:hypothetical protein